MEFIEAPAFNRHLSEYLGDEDYRALQVELVTNPEMGDVCRIQEDFASSAGLNWPVQFLPPQGALEQEALDEAGETDYEGTPTSVLSAEHRDVSRSGCRQHGEAKLHSVPAWAGFQVGEFQEKVL